MAKIPTRTLFAMAGAAAMKARDYARENPDKVGQALDRVESTVSSRTHGKYDAKLGKGSSALRRSLGLTPTGTTHPAVGTTPPPPPPTGSTPPPPTTGG
ncbi:antitoxin [Oryzobacter terrae]|uniref:antitoxin n=1 Tax=Oryzobacter terrae TaxID=1620385 RepID=UPI00366F143A